ncbi:MAG TPA: response regulator transcription factor [Burkholderiales bacterium]|nr:response regulator transcription factor [Burkholderiales bacterium]
MSTPISAAAALNQRILIVDDDQSLAAMLADYLSAMGFSVAAAATGAEGLARLAAEPFDALILDVMLPDTDGFEVCRQVRARHDLPVLMLTARGDETDRIVGLELGADDYLPKPFNPRELAARLKAILRRRGGAHAERGAPLRFGRLEIDRDARSVRVAGEERGMTGYQFDLLVVLAENAGRVMSREALMDRVRGEELDAFDRSIDVHISRIRAAIEDDPRHPRRIITVRGAGYVFARNQDEGAPG